MSTSYLKQRVPLTTDGQFITTEWLKDLQKEIASTGSSDGSSPVTVAMLATTIASLNADLTALKARVAKLEAGYQE